MFKLKKSLQATVLVSLFGVVSISLFLLYQQNQQLVQAHSQSQEAIKALMMYKNKRGVLNAPYFV